MQRRNILMGSAGLATAAIGSRAKAAETPTLRGPYIDLTTGKGNMILRARMGGDLDETKVKYGSVSGIVSGVRPNEKVLDMFGFEVVSVARNEKQPDGSYRNYHRESILYTDLATGEILTEYTNPYTEERVRVVDVINDPWNIHIAEYVNAGGPSYGGLNEDAKAAQRKEYVLNWMPAGNGLITAMTTINLYYRNALQPDKWPRESSGPMNQVSECYTHVVSLADAQNEKLTSISSTGTWSRVTPWLPWMLMGQAPGHVLYQSIVRGVKDVGGFKKPVREHMEKYHPHMLEAPPPESWEKPNLSSLEVYAATETPAPVK
ncbi:MAG: DUF1838 family protein [Rhodobacteraceae bacterium]|nr:DUF1838 family protein [Paracoccaceae bacterium]